MNSGLLEPVIREVRRLAEERPDFVYVAQPEHHDTPRCYYYGADGKGNGTGCIIGEAAKALGASSETLLRMDDSRSVEEALSIVLRKSLEFSATPGVQGALWWLGSVQINQDMGESWRSAVEKADSSKIMGNLA